MGVILIEGRGREVDGPADVPGEVSKAKRAHLRRAIVCKGLCGILWSLSSFEQHGSWNPAPRSDWEGPLSCCYDEDKR
jgi:hypothetical protein